jgi:type VI secretion system (T6SS) effector TldE1-like protein
MSQATLAGRNRKPSQHSALIRRLSGAALASLVLACGWVVYTNIFAASVYPTLGGTDYDEPVVRAAPQRIGARNAAQAVNEAFAALPSQSSVVAKPAPMAATPPSMFNERFAAAQSQGVESKATEVAVAPMPAAPRLAEAPKAVAAAKLADASRETSKEPSKELSKSKEAAPAKVAMNVPPPAAAPEATPAKSQGMFGDMAQRAKAAVMSITGERQSITEKLWGKPSPSGAMLAYASADASVTGGLGNPNPALGGSPPYERDTAVYDISAHMVYLPDGTKLEAHSGLGSKLDDPGSAKIKMHGVTPPHIYELKPREALFHGVPALRLNPIGGEDAIYGRVGLLAHTYMLGPNGDSNGCVSFRDYNAFLDAYRNKGIRKLAVLVRI